MLLFAKVRKQQTFAKSLSAEFIVVGGILPADWQRLTAFIENPLVEAEEGGRRGSRSSLFFLLFLKSQIEVLERRREKVYILVVALLRGRLIDVPNSRITTSTLVLHCPTVRVNRLRQPPRQISVQLLLGDAVQQKVGEGQLGTS